MMTFWFFYGLTGLFIFWYGMEEADRQGLLDEKYLEASVTKKLLAEAIAMILLILFWPAFLAIGMNK